MDVMDLPHIGTILSNLETIANEVRTNRYFCQDIKEQLKDYGYNWFDFHYARNGEQVMKVLAVAVNEAIQKKVDLKNQLSVDQELHQLFDIDDDKLLDHYFVPRVSHLSRERMLKTARSPLDMAEFLKESAPQWLVKKMIEHQFDIRWNTRTGEPNDYTFHEFCDKMDTTKQFKYKPRQAHVKAMLYKEHRRESVYYLRRITKEKLCPIVYIRTTRGWKSWQADEEDEFEDVNIEDDFSWINPSIRKFITENADEQEVQSLANSLDKPTLYWAVLNDGEFYPGDNLSFEEIGKTQVYVGKANNGIRGRWINGDNHCAMIKECLERVYGMTTYDPSILEGIQLVDVRLALAEVRREKTALFVIKTFGDDVEKAKLVQQKAKVCLDEAEEIYFRRSGIFNRFGLRAEVMKRREELDEAIAIVDDLQDSKTTSKAVQAEAEDQLTRAEKLHRKGKRIHEPWKNIIPHKDYKILWKPKDMRYGMNFN